MAETTAQEQLILEMINRARMDPAGEAARYGIDLNKDLASGTIISTPKQVLASNPLLNDAADAHSTWMLDTDTFSHTGVNGSSAFNRMTNAGYVFSGSWSWGENIAWTGTTGTLNVDAAAAQHHQNLFLSAGHRVNILKDGYREVGIGSVVGKMTTSSATYNALMTTQNFASSGSNFFVTGVVYNDASGDDFYSIGEGQGGRTVTLLQNGAATGMSTSGAAGGYSIATAVTGSVEVRFSGTGLAAPVGAIVMMASSNVKVDLVDGNTIFSNVSAALTELAANLQLIGIDNVNGTGNELANTITGNKGNNILAGGAGNDILIGAAGVDTFLGGDGDDIIHAEAIDNLVQSFGGSGFDKIYIAGGVPAGFDYAANGFEELWVNGSLVASTGSGGGTTPSEIIGTEEDDSLVGTPGNDIIRGLGGNDLISGGAGADRMHGGAGNDTYIVDNTGDIVDETDGSGIDTVVSSITFSLADTAKVKSSVENLTLTGTAAINGTGNSLNNTIMGNAGNNVLSGGSGIDTVSYENATAGVTVNLGNTKGQNTGGAGTDRISGFENLTGSDLGDRLTGSSGNNVLRGLDGNDTISGGRGADILIGGQGMDILQGGDGQDRFVFQSILDGPDIIVDFRSGTDKLDLTELADSVGLGDASYATLVANGHIIVTTGHFFTGLSSNSSSAIDTLVYFDADGAGDGAWVLIATLEDVKLTSGDFLV